MQSVHNIGLTSLNMHAKKIKFQPLLKWLVSLVLIIAITIYIAWSHTRVGCELNHGHWNNVKNECITSSCYETNSCGRLASPVTRCKNLNIGDSIGKVYFNFGDPETIDGTKYTWSADKVSTNKIEAIIMNDVLEKLVCNAI